MSIGDAIMGLMYGNPMQQAVQPPGPQGGPPAAGGPGAGGGGPAAAGGAPGAPQAQPQPRAYQSPADLSQMYVKLVQQSRAADSFDRGLALMAGGFKGPPGGAQTIMNSVGPPLDAGATMSNIMQLQQFHQQQLGALDAAKTLGISQNEALGMPAETIRTAMQIGIQPEKLREYNAWANQAAQEHQKDIDPTTGQPLGLDGARKLFEQQNPMGLAMAGTMGGAGVAAPMIQRNMESAEWQRRNPGQPLPSRFDSDEALAAYKGQQAALGASQQAAAGGNAALQGGLDYMKGNVTSIAQSPKLQGLLTKLQQNPLLVGAARKANWLVQQAPADYGLDQDETELLHKIDNLTLSDTGKLQSAAPHLGGQIGAIQGQLGTLQDFNSGPDNWKTNLTKLNDAIDTTSVNGHAAAGQLQTVLDKSSSNSEMKIDPSYLPGGRAFLGDPKQMSASDVAAARQAMIEWEKKYPGQGRARYIRHLQVQGFAPASGL